MKTDKKRLLRKLLWHLLMAACVAVYATGLAIVCEGAARQNFDTFVQFAQTELGQLALGNTALLAGLLILTLYFLTTKISAAMALVSVPLLLCHLISAFKLKLRSEPFYPWAFPESCSWPSPMWSSLW